MAWIKRNLLFVIGAVVALALLGFAGYYNYTGWKLNETEWKNLEEKYAELNRLNNLPIHPGSEDVDNIKLARAQQKQVREMIAAVSRNFQRLPAIPNTPAVSSAEFQSALRSTIDQLTREAGNASVTLPPDYKFSFFQQFRQLNFAPGSLEPLAAQLGEVKALCDVLIRANINSLDGIQRARVSEDDLTGPQSDYLDQQPQTNELAELTAVLTPYQIMFRSFSPEIAEVLAGFANSPHGIIVKGINVEPAPVTTEPTPGAPAMVMPVMPVMPAAPQYRATPRSLLDEEAAERAALRPDLYKSPPPTAYRPTYVMPTVPGARTGTGLQTMLSEKPLRVSIRVEVVKLLPRARS